MRIQRQGYASVALVIVVAILGGLGYSLARSQSRARHHQETEFIRRAQLAARLTAGGLESGGGQGAATTFSGTGRGLAGAMRAWEATGTPDQAAGLLDARGRLLVTWPIGSARRFAASVPRREVAAALRGSRTIYGDLVRIGPRGRPLVWSSVPLDTTHGRRVLVSLTSAVPLAAFADPYLRSAPAVDGARAYLIDGHGLVLASSLNLPQGAALPTPSPGRAVLDRRAGGRLGAMFWAIGRVESGTDWRILFTVPYRQLVAGVTGPNGVAWLLFSAFALAVFALVGVGAAAIRSSAKLSGARERESASRRLAQERLHDSLTGLPNRALFLDRAERALVRARESGRSVAVMFSDVDRFKRINDSLGPEAGDQLLTALARRVRDAVRARDTVGRFGGDEFLVLCDELSGEEEALRIAAGIRRALEQPFRLGDRSVHVSCCIGVAISSSESAKADADELIRDADAAMYAAKAAGPGSLQVSDEGLHAEALNRLDTELALRAAFGRTELFVHYQPIVSLPDGRIRGVEALSRWNRQGVGLVAPNEFIGLAEECGLIEEIGRLVLNTAMQDVEAWHEAGLLPDDFVVSVNVSPRQLANSAFPEQVEELLTAWRLDPATLCLEITESAVALAPQTGEDALTKLRGLGLRLAIDDFGVGISSLRRLVQSMRFDVIKLDRSFVAGLDRRPERSVVAAVATAAESLGLAAVAEGVERPDQAQLLSALGYTLAQGYHFARPMTADALRSMLLREPRTAGASR
jgi:diguanylate cyclase (GGDEF)-like protein